MEETLRFTNGRGLRLVGDLLSPPAEEPRPVVVFAHGWGSSRRSPRNRALAEAVVAAGMSAFLFDFTGHGESEGEAADATVDDQVEDLRCAVDRVAARLRGPIGLAGSSSGAAVAVAEAVEDPRIRAIVLRAPSVSARIHQAARLSAPTLVVQGRDDPLFHRNRELALALTCESRLVTVPRAGHLFEEPGTFDVVVRESVEWFARWLAGRNASSGGHHHSASLRTGPDAPRAHFRDRREAGGVLARRLERYRGPGTLVVALPRGGVPVGEAIALALDCDLDVFVSVKLRAPDQPELAAGAVAEGDRVIWNDRVVAALGLDDSEREWELRRARRELAERVATYRAVLPRAPVRGRTLILVDDGVATGATLKAAVSSLASEEPGRLVVALPGGPRDTLEEIARLPGVAEVAAVAVPEDFRAVGQLYDSFEQVATEEVTAILRRARERRRALSGAATQRP